MKGEPASHWEASRHDGHLTLRGTNGSHVYDDASESQSSKVLRQLQEGANSKLYPGGNGF